MPSSAGPNTAGESNLVFAYDTGDIINSYKGEPTTNNAVGLGLVDLGAGLTYLGIEDGWKKYSMNGTWSGGTYPYSMALDNVGFTGGLPYSCKAILKTSAGSKFNYFATSGISYVNQPKDYEGTLSSTPNPDGSTTVTRVNFAYTSTTSQLGYLFTNPVSGITFNPSTDFVWVKEFQAEQKTHPTQYVNGTRSVTQGLVSLASNYTVDLTNASYDSNAQISLDASNDYIKVAQNANFYTNDWTWEMVVKFTNNTGTYQGLVWAEGDTGGGSGLQYLLTLVNNTYLHYRVNNTTTGWANTDTANITFNPLLYNHIVWQFSNGTTKIYINGTLFHTNTSRGPYSGGSNSPMFLGARNDGSYGAPIIPTIYKFYNQALTATQIAQNYQAYKSRFNLT